MTGLHASARLLGFFLLSLLAMFTQALMIGLRAPLRIHVPQAYFRLVASLLRMRVHVEGELPERKAALIIANHASWLDIVAFSTILPVVFVAKREVKSWPFFGWLARLGGTIFIDRNKRQAAGVARDSMQAMLAEGRLVVLFPEGTTSDGNRVLPFRSSLLGAAGEASDATPLIPALIGYWGRHGIPMNRSERARYAWFGSMDLPVHLWRVVKAGPFDVTVRFFPPLETGQGRKAASRQAESLLRQALAGLLTGRDRPAVSSRADLR